MSARISAQTEHYALSAQAMIEEMVETDKVVGISAAIYQENGMDWTGSAGFMDLINKTPSNNQMIHRTASISKPMTAVAILQLYENGKLLLKDPIQKYLPDFPVHDKDTITILHLLQHSSGIKAYKSSKEAFSHKNYPSLLDAINVFKHRGLEHKPGSAFLYSTYGYVVLGAIIEKVSGQSYREYMKNNIWDPSDMHNTDIEVKGKQYANKSLLYTADGNKGFILEQQTDLSIKIPGGGIQSTVGDLVKFGRAIMNHTLIKKETYQLMITDSGIKKRGNPYGLGWFLYAREDSPSGRIIGHSGAQAGTATQFMILPDKNTVIAVLSNTTGAWNDIFSLVDRLDDIILKPDQFNEPYRKTVRSDRNVLNDVEGIYTSDNGSVLQIFRKEGILLVQYDTSQWYTLIPSSTTEYFSRIESLSLICDKSIKDDMSVELVCAGVSDTYFRKDKRKSLGMSLYNQFLENGDKAAAKWYKRNEQNQQYIYDPLLMNEAAYHLMRVGMLEESLEVLKTNVSRSEGESVLDKDVMLDVAKQLKNAGVVEMSTEFLQLALKDLPGDYDITSALASTYAVSGNDKKAAKYRQKAEKLKNE